MLHDEQPQSATFLGVFVSVKRIVNLCVLFGILNCARGSSTELTQAPELLKTAKPWSEKFQVEKGLKLFTNQTASDDRTAGGRYRD